MASKLIKFVLFALGVLVGYSLARRGQFTAAQRREYAELKRSHDGVQRLFAQFRRESEARKRTPAAATLFTENSDTDDVSRETVEKHSAAIQSLAESLAYNEDDKGADFYRAYYFQQKAKHRYMADQFKSDRDARRVQRLQGGA